MPILSNAKKALRSSKRKAVVNARVRSRMRTMVKQMKTSPSVERLPEVFSSLDRAVKKNLIHSNAAARVKSQLSKLLSALK
jgi:small subunit ribosomal protein S20